MVEEYQICRVGWHPVLQNSQSFESSRVGLTQRVKFQVARLPVGPLSPALRFFERQYPEHSPASRHVA